MAKSKHITHPFAIVLDGLGGIKDKLNLQDIRPYSFSTSCGLMLLLALLLFWLVKRKRLI